jgi:hypothetical protein
MTVAATVGKPADDLRGIVHDKHHGVRGSRHVNGDKGIGGRLGGQYPTIRC